MNVKDKYVLLSYIKREFWPSGHWSWKAASFLETAYKTSVSRWATKKVQAINTSPMYPILITLVLQQAVDRY